MNKNKIIRTRYAPSPTGLFHIGGARTALFNYLFAKKNNGDFIVRIEDTDIDRNVENGIESQLLNLKWLKIFPDESPLNPGNYGPYIQTERLPIYKEKAEQLLKEKKAYRCFCTPEQLEKNRKKALKDGKTPKYNRTCLSLSEDQISEKIKNNIPFSLRFKITDNTEIKWNDIVRGEMCVPTSALTDPVILKSNGIPTYNFAVVIDDNDMLISHIIRGEEHLSNTPYQIAINEALDINKNIVFGHLSVIIDETGKKLSKRNMELKQFIEDYKNMGFSPEAIVNFMYLLGLSSSDNKEIFSLAEAVKNFDIKKVSKSPTTFDFKKMEWISSEHFKMMSDSAFISFAKPFITIDLGFLKGNENDVILLFKNQIAYAKQINDLIDETFFSPETFAAVCEKFPFLKQADTKELIKVFIKQLQELPNWNISEIATVIDAVKKQTGKSGKELFMPIRVYSSHNSHGPELAKVIFILGKDKVIKNAKSFLDNKGA
ncbi:glutamate--tRNA ligase [Malacoplasma penetrans]|uniref:Glutamate--tRNA ligase n=1 Tax=Malacoplasma penetrans (strain HF-2) TaxID=272633 RepID=SYE_MALP2|nr:glutamate--tRNA ligase [Malacoplasma penetrans]Q8EU94.1 RecName: Full=Glutamate--tRNA ligase; AltName: Full=Glutamyl-tRNA synthetase; Short=GluRS [Malacoplasma penetrans HF-2]RXY96875.1 glutamate--tRNA ligase [Malacoplasma penetrans]BAC44822.1 glutamyl-tRNA synthetase [Malacoplasma penetrans HF-2]